MSRSLSILVVAALFLSGVAIGALGMHVYYWQSLRSHGPANGAHPPRHSQMLGWIERELGLSTAQRSEIREILDETSRRASEIRFEMRPRVESLMAETTGRISEVLTPEQRERFEQLRVRQHRRFREGFLGGPPTRGRRGRRGQRHQPSPPPPPSESEEM